MRFVVHQTDGKVFAIKASGIARNFCECGDLEFRDEDNRVVAIWRAGIWDRVIASEVLD